jgi:RNase P/RNase MRP subunit p29
VNIRDFESEESKMINELLGKEVSIVTSYVGALYTVKGEIVEIRAPWLKLMEKNKPIYINLNQIIQVKPK